MAATIQIPVTVLDEKCITFKAMSLDKQDLYAGPEVVYSQYQCTNLHLCQYIRGRIVRGEQENKEPEKEETGDVIHE